MSTAAFVLGIISLLIGFIPLFGTVAYIPAILAIIFGLVGIFKKTRDGEPKKGKGLAIAGIVLSIIAIIIINSMNSAIGDSINETFSDNITVTQNNQSSSNPDTTSTEPTTCSVGQTIQNKDLKVSFLSLNDNFTGYSKYATVKDGCKVIKADFEFENISNSDQLASSYDFNCYADGYDCESFYSVDDSSFSSTLSAGKKSKGSVYFQVPTTATQVVLEYETNVWTSSKLIFTVK